MPIAKPPPGRLTQILSWLRITFLDPLEPLAESEQLLKVRLLSGLVVGLIAGMLLGLRLGAEIPWWIFVCLLLAYVVGRTHFYQLAAVMVTLLLFIPSYLIASRLTGEDTLPMTAAFSWQLIPLIFCSLILPSHWLLFLLVVNLLGMIALPPLAPYLFYSTMVGAYGLISSISISLFITQRLRDRLEQERQDQLRLNEARFRSLTEQLATINEISALVSSLSDLPAVLELIYQQVQRIIPSDSFIISLFNSESKILSFPYMVEDGQRLHQTPLQLKDDTSLAQMLHNRKPVLFYREPKRNFAYLLRFAFGRNNQEARSVMIVPLRKGDGVLGSVTMQSYKPLAYSQEHLNILVGIANQAATAIDNARLYQALQSELAERTRAEEAVRTLNIELEQRVRERTAQMEVANQELESFSHSVSHDLRAPLRAIHGYSAALQQDFTSQLDENAKTYLERILQATRRMSSLIDDLLDLARITRSEMRLSQVDLGQIGQEVIQLLRQQEPHRSMEFTVQPGLVARADANLVRVALENLLGNAWKFTSHHPTARIELGEMQQEGQAVFFVRDDGAGFDMVNQDRLFVEFQRLHPADQFDGTGIGLVTVRRIIQRHGGRIWAEGEPEKGAVFYFTLETKSG